MKLHVTIFTVTLLLLSLFSFAEELKGKVTAVIDGNTLEVYVLVEGSYRILLHGIDCPESGQQYFEQAKVLLEQTVMNKFVTISITGKDRLGNRLGVINMEGTNDPRHQLLKAGYAWTTEKNPDPELELLREIAKSKGKGLWSEANPVPPWLYRRQMSMQRHPNSVEFGGGVHKIKHPGGR